MRFAALASIVLALGVTAPSISRADDSTSDDFRVRAVAAARIGRTKPAGARETLERLLTDAHPVVRGAAAAALATLGDPAAVGALDARARVEPSDVVKKAIDASLTALRQPVAPSLQNARFLLRLGTMRNATSARGPELAVVLSQASQTRARSIPGVVLTDGRDDAILRQASERHIPYVILDGAVVSLTQTKNGMRLQVTANVEFDMRVDQAIKGKLTGGATAIDSIAVSTDAARVRDLENQAVQGAVESAMRGAPSGMALASR